MNKRPVSVRSLRITALAILAVTAAATALLLFLPASEPPAPGDDGQPVATDAHAAFTISEPSPVVRESDPTRIQTVTDPTMPFAEQHVPTTVPSTPASGRPIQNPFIADPDKIPASTSGTAPDASIRATPSPTAATTARYAKESAFFLRRLPFLEKHLRSSRFITETVEVDTANPTSMVILANSAALAENLDGFFRFTIDRDGETWGNAPLALGIMRLYTDSGRDKAYADGTFCSDGLEGVLDGAVRAILDTAYEPGMTTFILEQYRAGRIARSGGGTVSKPATRVVASFSWLDVVYNDGYVTYVEFYPDTGTVKA